MISTLKTLSVIGALGAAVLAAQPARADNHVSVGFGIGVINRPTARAGYIVPQAPAYGFGGGGRGFGYGPQNYYYYAPPAAYYGYYGAPAYYAPPAYYPPAYFNPYDPYYSTPEYYQRTRQRLTFGMIGRW